MNEGKHALSDDDSEAAHAFHFSVLQHEAGQAESFQMDCM